MKRVLFIVAVIGLVLCSRPASAQAISSYTLKIYNQGASIPISPPVSLAAAGFTCGLVPLSPPTGTVQNPRKIRLQDPADATKECEYTDPGTGPLLSLPFGTQIYVATLAAVNTSNLSSADSTNSNPFAHLGTAPGTPAGVKVVQ